jgi:hypothetical protein
MPLLGDLLLYSSTVHQHLGAATPKPLNFKGTSKIFGSVRHYRTRQYILVQQVLRQSRYAVTRSAYWLTAKKAEISGQWMEMLELIFLNWTVKIQ